MPCVQPRSRVQPSLVCRHCPQFRAKGGRKGHGQHRSEAHPRWGPRSYVTVSNGRQGPPFSHFPPVSGRGQASGVSTPPV